MSILNANQVKLGNIVSLDAGEFRIIGGAYGSVTKYYLVNTSTNEFSKKADSIEELLGDEEVLVISGVAQTRATFNLTESEPEVGSLFVAMIGYDEGVPSMELRQVIGSENGDKFFAIDPVTGARKTKTKSSMRDVFNAYDEVLAL